MPVGQKTLLQVAIDSYVLPSSGLTVAVDKIEAATWDIEGHIQAFSPKANITLVPRQARGALASALYAVNHARPEEPLVIAAGDSIIRGGISSHIEYLLTRRADAGTVVFDSTGERWSYLSADAKGNVTEVAEKYQLGNLATTGVFFFRTAKSFVDAAQWVLLQNANVEGNFYVSTALNFLISQSKAVKYSSVEANDYLSWSRPADFFRNSQRGASE